MRRIAGSITCRGRSAVTSIRHVVSDSTEAAATAGPNSGISETLPRCKPEGLSQQIEIGIHQVDGQGASVSDLLLGFHDPKTPVVEQHHNHGKLELSGYCQFPGS